MDNLTVIREALEFYAKHCAQNSLDGEEGTPTRFPADKALKALSALEDELKAREWQDISTAPRDGTRIIVALFVPHFEISPPVIGGIPESKKVGYALRWASRAEWDEEKGRWHDGCETLAAPNFWRLPKPPSCGSMNGEGV